MWAFWSDCVVECETGGDFEELEDLLEWQGWWMSGYEGVFIIHVVGFGGGEYGSLVLLEAMMRGIDGAGGVVKVGI